MWTINILCTKQESFAFSMALEGFADSLSIFELSDDNHWAIEAIYNSQPEETALQNQLQQMALACGLPCPKFTIEKLPQKDWLSENQKSFPPISIAGFFIHGSHITPEIPQGNIELIINAATAFGTGAHETTSGCIEAIKYIAQHATINHPLDLGCGTAILAMAAAKTFNCHVTAVDNDPEAVAVSQLNLQKNHLDHLVTTFVNDGMQGEKIQNLAPFDLIIANILAGPLCIMAQDIVNNIIPGGYLILSGILNTQALSVRQAYLPLNMTIINEFQRNDWSILIMQKLPIN